jgi:hypothetical protein
MRFKALIWVSAVGAVWGCGGGDDSEPSSGGGSYSGITESIAKPSGQLEASNASDVADEFSKVNAASPGGQRLSPQQASQKQEMACPSGGKYIMNVSGGQAGGQAIITYDSCCYAASCCFDGSANWYYAAKAGADYSFCGTWNVDLTCGNEGGGSIKYEGCVGMDGKMVYVVRVDGKTFAVTGNYANGSGTLEIKGANGTFTCTYTNHSGSCTSSSGASFTF